MEFSRLVKAVLHKDVAPAVNPDPRLVEDLATAMGHITILHKGCPDLISNGKVRSTHGDDVFWFSAGCLFVQKCSKLMKSAALTALTACRGNFGAKSNYWNGQSPSHSAGYPQQKC